MYVTRHSAIGYDGLNFDINMQNDILRHTGKVCSSAQGVASTLQGHVLGILCHIDDLNKANCKCSVML